MAAGASFQSREQNPPLLEHHADYIPAVTRKRDWLAGCEATVRPALAIGLRPGEAQARTGDGPGPLNSSVAEQRIHCVIILKLQC